MDPQQIDELMRRLSEAIPSGARELKQELEKNLRALLTSAVGALDLVTREEFDVQTAVLARTRTKLEVLEQQVATLERQVLGKPSHDSAAADGPAEARPSVGHEAAGSGNAYSSPPESSPPE
jgi:ubiquinone biosynthesis accessory factor UbiK